MAAVLLGELADELEAEINARYHGLLDAGVMQRRFNRDMDPVYRARKWLIRDNQKLLAQEGVEL